MIAAIRLEPVPGADIADVAREAYHLIGRVDQEVVFNFNGVECWVMKHDTPNTVVQWYHRSLERMSKLGLR